jgi:major histocompatibility complex class I
VSHMSIKNVPNWPAVVVHTFNPSTWEAEASGFLSSRPDWSTE